MFEALGSRERQDVIRSRHPEDKHCDLLCVSPNACDGCRYNPVGKKLTDKTIVEENDFAVAWALQLGEYASAGMLPDVSRLRPQEALAAKIACQHQRLEENKVLAKLIANELAEVLAPALGIKRMGL